jgi:predicted Zn-dependent protease
MKKIQKYQKKIKKYRSKLSKVKFKEKLNKLVFRIGLQYPVKFKLIDLEVKEILFPCHLGILFCGKFEDILFEKTRNELERIFDSFFFDIRNLGEFNFPIKIFSKGLKSEYEEFDNSKKMLVLHPTNKFYQILIDERIDNRLDMIIAVTDLPIYSSSDDTIAFLFGEAHSKHRCCVVSSLMLKEQFYNRPKNKNLFEQRIVKEVIHEIGHLILGLEHCDNNSCVMHYSEAIEEIDSKSFKLCEDCALKLKRVRAKYNF